MKQKVEGLSVRLGKTPPTLLKSNHMLWLTPLSISPFYTRGPDSSLTRLRDRNSDLYKRSQPNKSRDHSLTRLRHRFYSSAAVSSCFESDVLGRKKALDLNLFGKCCEFVSIRLSVAYSRRCPVGTCGDETCWL